LLFNCFFDRIHIDDPVGAVSVHGVCGLFGVLCVGLFADGTYGSGWNGTTDKPLLGLIPSMIAGNISVGVGQLMAQIMGIITLLVWAFGFSLIFFKVQKIMMGLRVSPEDEIAGLDIPETGVLAYPAFIWLPNRANMESITPRLLPLRWPTVGKRKSQSGKGISPPLLS
jgi:Amt family ammonium transporter